MRYLIPTFLILAMGAASAQQPPQAPDPAFMQKAMAALQQQRNEALDRAAGAEARLAVMADELQKAKIDLAQLKAKYEPPKAAEPPAGAKKE